MNKTDTKHVFALLALSLIILTAAVIPASADTSIKWTKDIGDITAVCMSEDGTILYAAVQQSTTSSVIYEYDDAGVEQNQFSGIEGVVTHLVCTQSGNQATFATDANLIYYIDNGEITWTRSFSSTITDLDISNIGSVLVVESTQFHKLLNDGSVEYDSTAGTYELGVIDPNDEFAILGHSSSNALTKYILSTTNQYWGKINNNTFNTAFSNYQNALVLTPDNISNPLIISPSTVGSDVFSEVYIPMGNAISDSELSTTNSYTYSDSYGSTWSLITSSANYTSRSLVASWVFNNKIWIGNHDIWCSEDGINWTQVTASSGMGARFGACCWVYNNKMWLAGGRTSSTSTKYNDVWSSSDGASWTRVTSSAGWSARHGSAYWVFDNKMWLAGGQDNTNALRDVWYSTNGASWTQATTAASWSVRLYSTCWVYNNKMWLAGGYNGGSGSSYARLNDVWYSSNGISWSRATSAAQWSARQQAVGWVYDDKMWLAGGDRGASEIWCSVDGATWTKIDTPSGWGSSYSEDCCWLYKDTVYLGRSLNVWKYNPDIESQHIIIQPNHDGQIYIFYNPTTPVTQHTQATYTNAVDFSGTFELQTKPELTIYELQATKTLSGNINSLSLSDRGDWLGVLTTSNIIHDQIINTGFGTEYSGSLGGTGTVYNIATANGAGMSVVGQGLTTDIYTLQTSRVGTYTTGGQVEHVDIADKNALWATAGGDDGKVYVFSKDASSNWYLEYSSDSEMPITALKMSSRGEYILAGRTNSLTLYQTNTPEVVQTDFWFTLYAYKDSDSYRNAAVNVSVYQGNQWNSFAQGLTDSAGKYVVQLTAGQTYKFDVGNGQKVVVVMASPSVQSQTVNIHTSPISGAISYEAKWNDEINGLDLKYNDNSGQTNSVTVKVQRTDTWETVYEQTFTDTQNIDEQLPIVDDTTSYKVQFSANRVSGTSRNSFVLSSSRDIIPIPLDQNIKNVLFSCFLIVLAGLFSYMSAIRGALVVAFSATLFVYLGWLTIPWHWLIIAIVIAIVAGFTQRRG